MSLVRLLDNFRMGDGDLTFSPPLLSSPLSLLVATACARSPRRAGKLSRLARADPTWGDPSPSPTSAAQTTTSAAVLPPGADSDYS